MYITTFTRRREDYRPDGSGPILLAAELDDRNLWIASGNSLQKFSVRNGELSKQREFPFEINHLQTTRWHVIVAGESQLQILDLAGATKRTHECAVRKLCTDFRSVAFCVKDNPHHIYVHEEPSQEVSPVLLEDQGVSQIALSNCLLAAAHPAKGEVAIWVWKNTKAPYLRNTVKVELPIEALFFSPSECLALWNGKVVVWHGTREPSKEESERADFCSFNSRAVACFYRVQPETTVVELNSGQFGTASEEFLGHFTEAVATDHWIALLSNERRIAVYTITRSKDCAIS